LIGRVAITSRTQWQHLPQPLTGRGKEIDELTGTRTQITDAMGTRQRGRMKQKAAGAVHDDQVLRLDGLGLDAESTKAGCKNPPHPTSLAAPDPDT
jgi:hypothetical protein